MQLVFLIIYAIN